MAKKVSKRRQWTKKHVRKLKKLAKKKIHAASIAKTLKRSEGATRQKAFTLGLSLELAGLKFPPANPKAALWTQAPLCVGLVCEPPARGAILLLGLTGVYSSARLKTRALALSTNRLNAARRNGECKYRGGGRC